MRYQHFLRTLALFYRKKEKKEIKTKFGSESKFLVKRFFNSLNDRGSWIGSIFTNNHRSLKLQALQWDNLCIPASTDATSQRLSLSYAEASLCRIETGEREKGNHEGSDGKAFSSSHHPPRALKFLIIAFFIEIPNGSLLGGESRQGHIPMKK